MRIVAGLTLDELVARAGCERRFPLSADNPVVMPLPEPAL
jgi:hypothetical protein